MERPSRSSTGRCRWRGKFPSPARGVPRGSETPFGRWVQGERSLPARRPAARRWPWGCRGSLEAHPDWRWTGHNGPPWFGAGGAGKLQAWRVMNRRNGSMARSRTRCPIAPQAGGCNGVRSGPLPRWCWVLPAHILRVAARSQLQPQSVPSDEYFIQPHAGFVSVYALVVSVNFRGSFSGRLSSALILQVRFQG